MAMGAEGREGRRGGRGVQSLGTYGGSRGGCNTCTWHGQCVRYPTNARKPPRHSPSNPVSRTHRISPLPPLCTRDPLPPRARGRARARAMSPFPSLRILLPADACNSPMLNATFTSLHLREAPTRALLFPPHSSARHPPPDPPRPPERRDLCTVYASSASTRVYRAPTTMVSIDSCQSEARG